MDLKIAVVSHTVRDFREYVRATGAPPEAVEVFYFVNKESDTTGMDFIFVLHTWRAERDLKDFHDIIRRCKMRIKKP